VPNLASNFGTIPSANYRFASRKWMKPIPPTQKSNQKAPTLEINRGVQVEIYFQLPDLGSIV